MKKSTLRKLITSTSAVCAAAAAITFSSLSASAAAPKYGDANGDGEVNMADAVAIMRFQADPDDYQLSAEGKDLADVFLRGDGVTNMDALSIQKFEAGIVTELPESYQEGGDTTTTTTSKQTQTTTSTTAATTTTTTTTTPQDPVTDTVYIHLNGTSIAVDGDNSGYTAVSGSKVTISHSGTYYIDGTLDDGQIEVNVADEAADPETVKLFLNGASITGKSDSAILITNAENTSINLVDGTENTVTDGDTAYVSGAAVIEAKDDLTIKGGDLGTGILNVTANTQNGIVCNNDIKVTGGVLNVTALNATDETNGINGKTSLTVKGGTVNVEAEGDGIKSSKGNVDITDGTVYIKAGNDAVQSETEINISGGTVYAGGDRGLTAVTNVNITGGTVVATATDAQITNLTSANQAAMLLNCIACPDSTDGTWKKANSITVGNLSTTFMKKYSYVLISDASIRAGQSYTLKNASTGATVTYNNDANDSFSVTNSVTTFDAVNPAGKDGSSVVVTDPVTDGYTITLNGTTIATNAPSDVASISNGVLTITKEGTFTVTGQGTGTQINVNVDKNAYPNSVVELDLAGMSLTNEQNSPVYVTSIGDEVVIVAKNGTENTITDGSNYTNADAAQGAIYSCDDLKIKGKGKLTVNGKAADGIVCKNDLKIYNGEIVVNAVDDAIRGKDSVTIGDTTKSDGTAADNSGLSVTVKTTAGDGIKSTATDTATDKAYGVVTINGGTVNVTSFGDGIQGEQDVVINDGTINITTTGTGNDSSKGIKSVGLYDAAGTTYQSAGTLTVNGGMITVDSKDDSLHCSGTLVLNAGKLKLTSGDDAVHSDSKLYVGGMTAGTDYTSLEVYVTACYEGFEAAYIYQNNGNIYIISKDDGFNAAGGADGSGNTSTGGWSQGGGFPGQGGGMGGGAYGEMHLNGGIVSVNTSFQDADGFDSNGPVYFNGGYYFGNGGDSFDCGDGYSITYNGGYAFGGLGMNGGSGYDMTTQMVFTTSDGTVLATSMTGSRVTYAYGDSSVLAYSGAQVSGGTNISTLGQPATYISGKASGGTAMTLGSGSSSGGQNPWNPWG